MTFQRTRILVPWLRKKALLSRNSLICWLSSRASISLLNSSFEIQRLNSINTLKNIVIVKSTFGYHHTLVNHSTKRSKMISSTLPFYNFVLFASKYNKYFSVSIRNIWSISEYMAADRVMPPFVERREEDMKGLCLIGKVELRH